MARFYLPADEWEKTVWELTGDEAHHATKVLRLKEGSTCIVFDGQGRAAEACIKGQPHASSVLLERGPDISEPTSMARITLFQSVPKGSNMDLIIQKAVELGVSHIVPLITDRTIVRLNAKEAKAKQQKWQRVALEACKQCGQNTLPIVEDPQTFAEGIKKKSVDGVHLIASLVDGVKPIRDVLESARNSSIKEASLLVGPEGDFTGQETALALESGFTPVTLGNIVLRVETATFFGMAAIRYALD